MKHPRYSEFAYTAEFNPEEIKHAAEDTRERVYVQTGAGETADQMLAVHLTVAEGADRSVTPIVRLPAWSDDNSRREAGYFDALLSHATGHPVLTPNAPGVDFSEWRDSQYDASHLLTPDQLEDLHSRGSFRKVGAAVMNALDDASRHFNLSGDYLLHASSMAVAMGGAAIAARGESLRGVVLSEGANFSDRSLLALGAQFGLQQRYVAGYLKQNPDIIPGEAMGHWLGRTKEAWTANWAYIQALKRGAFLTDLGDPSALREQDIPVHMTRGSISRLADAAAHEDVYQFLKINGVTVSNKQYEGHDHPYTMTVQSVVDAVDEVA